MVETNAPKSAQEVRYLKSMPVFAAILSKLRGAQRNAIALGAITLLLLSTAGLLATHGPSSSRSKSSSPTAVSTSSSYVTYHATTSSGSTPATRGATPGTSESDATPPALVGDGATQVPTYPGSPVTPGSSPQPATPGATVPPISSPSPSQPQPYAFQVVDPLSPVASPAYDQYYVVLQNTGTNTWFVGNYSIVCISTCNDATSRIQTLADIPPGGQLRYTIGLVLPGPWTSATYHSIWRLDYNFHDPPTDSYFDLAITRTIAVIVDEQQAPSCGNPPGISWTYVNATGGNGISCGPSSLVMWQGVAAAPAAELTVIPANCNVNDFRTTLHVHFDDAASDAFAGMAFHVPTAAGQCDYIRVEIRPSGLWRVVDVIGSDCHDAVIMSGSLSPSSDYDLGASISPSSNQLYIDGIGVLNGGINGTDGVTALTVHSSTASSGAVEFSNLEYAMMVNQPDQFTVARA